MSRFKAVNGTDFKPVRFGDIVGCDEAKDELQDIVFYLRKPRQLAALGGKVPKGRKVLRESYTEFELCALHELNRCPILFRQHILELLPFFRFILMLD